MGYIQFYDWGVKNGVHTLRLHGTKEDLYNIVADCRALGEKFDSTPLINHVYKGQYTLLLKLKTVSVGVGNGKVNHAIGKSNE